MPSAACLLVFHPSPSSFWSPVSNLISNAIASILSSVGRSIDTQSRRGRLGCREKRRWERLCGEDDRTDGPFYVLGLSCSPQASKGGGKRLKRHSMDGDATECELADENCLIKNPNGRPSSVDRR